MHCTVLRPARVDSGFDMSVVLRVLLCWLLFVSCRQGPEFYCPEATRTRQVVAVGHYSTPETPNVANRTDVAVCPPGSFCQFGLRRLCPGGRYGSTPALVEEACSEVCPYVPTPSLCAFAPAVDAFCFRSSAAGFICVLHCRPGYFCPAGSSSATANPCGGEAVYCPQGSAAPVVAEPGELTVGGFPNGTTRTATQPCLLGSFCLGGVSQLCPAGRFGCSEYVFDVLCNGPCAAGFYCPRGSTSNQQHSCGSPAVFCPVNSSSPTPVDGGHYSLGGATPDRNSEQAICPLGSFCVGGVKTPCPGAPACLCIGGACCVCLLRVPVFTSSPVPAILHVFFTFPQPDATARRKGCTTTRAPEFATTGTCAPPVPRRPASSRARQATTALLAP